jgi:hypothetical protein
MKNHQEHRSSYVPSNPGVQEQAAPVAPQVADPGSRDFALNGVQSALQRAEDHTLQAKTGIPDEVRGSMESSFGQDFSSVRVHKNSAQAKGIGALAYTKGNDVHFAPGQYNPQSSSGRKLLGHELAHVVQQRQGRVRPTGSVGGMALNDSPRLEAEADRLGAHAAQHKPGA